MRSWVLIAFTMINDPLDPFRAVRSTILMSVVNAPHHHFHQLYLEPHCPMGLSFYFLEDTIKYPQIANFSPLAMRTLVKFQYLTEMKS
jgi:hypothetical protein